MEIIEVIQKSYSPYVSPTTIVEVEKSDETTKVCLYSDVTDLNKDIIKNARPISYQQTVFDRMRDVK